LQDREYAVLKKKMKQHYFLTILNQIYKTVMKISFWFPNHSCWYCDI